MIPARATDASIDRVVLQSVGHFMAWAKKPSRKVAANLEHLNNTLVILVGKGDQIRVDLTEGKLGNVLAFKTDHPECKKRVHIIDMSSPLIMQKEKKLLDAFFSQHGLMAQYVLRFGEFQLKKVIEIHTGRVLSL